MRYSLLAVSALMIALAATLAGCTTQGTATATLPPDRLPLHDELFDGFSQINVEASEDVFRLDEEAKRFARTATSGTSDPYDQMNTLIHKIFDRSEFNLLYMADANYTANQAFQTGLANCLSMSIMTYALAAEAGFEVRFRDVQIPEYWTRRDGHNVLSDHVNLVLLPPAEPGITRFLETGLEVDFDPGATRSVFPSRIIGKNTVLAMFFNNKGVDALLNNRHTEAYAYFRASAKSDRFFESPFINLGTLYRREGRSDLAELSYRYALAIDDENLPAWENLARLYERIGRTEEAGEIYARVERVRTSNPYYHFILGEQAYDNARFEEALTHYEKALSLDNSKHEIYFGLAKAHFALGNLERSEKYLETAKRKSSSHQDQERYQSKLDLFAATTP